MTPWRNGSASDSRSEGCVFKSRRGQLSFCNFYTHPNLMSICSHPLARDALVVCITINRLAMTIGHTRNYKRHCLEAQRDNVNSGIIAVSTQFTNVSINLRNFGRG